MATKEQYEYLRKVEGTLHAVEALLTSEQVRNVQHLIDHGEPAEGLCELAWIIHNGQKAVPREVKQAIRELVQGLVADEHMPEDFGR